MVPRGLQILSFNIRSHCGKKSKQEFTKMFFRGKKWQKEVEVNSHPLNLKHTRTSKDVQGIDINIDVIIFIKIKTLCIEMAYEKVEDLLSLNGRSLAGL